MLTLLLLFSYGLTGMARHYAIANSLIDVPNLRSSHQAPTPRGGGIAIVVTVIVAVAGLTLYFPTLANLAMALCGGGLVIAVLGWLDDHYSLSPKTRLLVQLLAVVWAVFWLGGLPQVTLNSVILNLGVSGFAIAVLVLLWLINLYNFMDGSDGLAASEAVFVALAGGVLLYIHGAGELALVAFAVAAASGGFLVWNWPPAKIFMGDVGSTFLGFVFGALAIASENYGKLPAAIWFILLALFITDATLTLMRRFWAGEAWYLPHRTHMYQRLISRGWNHRGVALLFAALNFLVLLPTVSLALFYPSSLPWLLGLIVSGAGMLWAIIQHGTWRLKD